MRLKRHVLALALAGIAAPVWATNGYFSHGYGMKSKGMAGAATATADDTFGGANNPAKMVWVGNRMDLGAEVFSPRRDFSSTAGVAIDSEDKYFLVPEFGYNRMLRPNLSLGVSVYGNGGMNTDYPNGAPYFSGTGDLGVDLMQLMLAPTLAYKVNAQHSIGISPVIAVQRFAAQGLQAFGVLNPGYDWSWGYGARIGWMGKLNDRLILGASYSTKIYMDEFDKYRGLFAEQGDFDIPSNWTLGIAIQATPQLRVALDYQRINYGDIKSINNPSQSVAPFGASNGPGFGWRDVDVWKLGIEYAYSKNLTLRAGWNHGDNPITPADVTFNILAPGVIKDHLTVGFTYTLPKGDELTMAYMHAFKESVTGNNMFNPANRDTIKMYQNSLGIAYSWKL